MNVSNIRALYGTEKVKTSKCDWKLTNTLKEHVMFLNLLLMVSLIFMVIMMDMLI